MELLVITINLRINLAALFSLKIGWIAWWHTYLWWWDCGNIRRPESAHSLQFGFERLKKFSNYWGKKKKKTNNWLQRSFSRPEARSQCVCHSGCLCGILLIMFTSGHSLHLLRCPTANWCTEAKAVCSRWIPGSLLNAAILGLNLDSRDIVGAWICQLCCIHSKLQGCSNNNRKCKIKMPALTAKPLFLYRPHSCQCWCWCVLHRRGNEHLHSVCLLNCPSLFLSFLFSLALRGNLILMATPPALRWVKDRPRCWSPPPAQAPRAAGHCLPGAPWHQRKATGHPKSLMVSGISHTWGAEIRVEGRDCEGEAAASDVARLYS